MIFLTILAEIFVTLLLFLSPVKKLVIKIFLETSSSFIDSIKTWIAPLDIEYNDAFSTPDIPVPDEMLIM